MSIENPLESLMRRFGGDAQSPQTARTDSPKAPPPQTREIQEPKMAVAPSTSKEAQAPTLAEFVKVLDDCFEGVEMDKAAKEAIKKSIRLNFEQHTNTAKLKERLSILFEYERNYLSLVKEYKEEIKFIGSLQEDLRKERAKFFSDTLKEVSDSLRDAQVSDDVASQWIKDLVDSYTRSLDLSSGIVEEQTVDTMGQIRKEAKNAVQAATQSEPRQE